MADKCDGRSKRPGLLVKTGLIHLKRVRDRLRKNIYGVDTGNLPWCRQQPRCRDVAETTGNVS